MYDITISQIVRAYYSKSDHWKRDYFGTRSYDAIVLFTEGEIEYHFAHKNVVARKGDILFLPGNMPYSGKRHTDSVAFFVLDFTCVSEQELERLSAPAVITPDNYELYYYKFSKIVELWNRQPIDITIRMKAFLYSIICELFHTEHKEQRTSATEEILEYIVENIGNPSLSVMDLCDHFFISESQLRRKLVKATGLPPNEYILTLRLNRAKNELIYTEKTIKQIAFESGFASQYYFSRCFSNSNGMSPREYRKQYLG